MIDFSTVRRVLVVAAHPDDETIGCGGMMAALALQGASVHVVFLADGEGARSDSAGAVEESLVEARQRAACNAADALGAERPIFLGLPDNRLDSLPLLDVVKQVERVRDAVNPDTVLLHHGGDLNVDHRIAHVAAITAFRPLPGSAARRLLSFETLSSTEWATEACGPRFRPNMFLSIADVLERKLAAFAAYAGEIRQFPHPRSKEGLMALAAERGSSVGLQMAEAFAVLRCLKP